MIVAVVLTYSAPAEMLRAAVASVRDGGGVDRIIVVDNGSGATGSLVGLEPGAVPCELIVTGENLGFAGGMNVGIEAALRAGADAIALLNDDVVVEPDWLGILAVELARDPRVGGVQPKLLFTNRDAPTINSVGVVIGRDGAGTDIGHGLPDDGSFDDDRDVEACTGGAVLLRSTMLREVGTFDARLFMYYEDVDLCRRAGAHGWKFRCLPAAVVWHHGSASANEVPARSLYYRERNRLWMLFRWAPPRTIVTGLWLSIRRLRHAPRRVHARALAAGLRRAPIEIFARWRPRSS